MAPPKGFKLSPESRALISIGLRWRWTNDPEVREKWSKAAKANANTIASTTKARERMTALNKNDSIREKQWNTRKYKSRSSDWITDPSTGIMSREVKHASS